MRRIYKRIISSSLLIPLFFVITFCCCLERGSFADEGVVIEHHHQDVGETQHSTHQHSNGDKDCSCAKHFSFLSAQSTDIIFVSTFRQMLAKDFLADLRSNNTLLIASLVNQSQGPPLRDYLQHAAIPIYLKFSNLRL